MINQQLSRYATHDNSAYPSLWRGCVGAWCPSLGPSGSRLHDYSRRQNWGTLTNMDPATDWVVDGGAYALDFDGSNDVVSVGSGRSGLVNLPTSGFSVSLWINIRSAGGNSVGTIIDNYNAANSQPGWYFLIRSVGGNTLAAQAGAGFTPTNQTQISADNFFTLNQWDHITLAFDASSKVFALYRNGTQISFPVNSSASATYNDDSGQSLVIGNRAAGDRALDGLLDDVRVYGRVLSFAEQRLLSRRRGIAFTPRSRRLGVIEQAAGGATPWLYARRRSQIIGSGGVH